MTEPLQGWFVRATIAHQGRQVIHQSHELLNINWLCSEQRRVPALQELVPMLELTGQSCLCDPPAHDLASVPARCDAMMTAATRFESD